MTDRNLIDIATDVIGNSYSPYSRFKVGAALECADGMVFTGCNIENAAFSAAICAEAAAVAAAVTAGRRKFKRIAIVSEGGNYYFPCGKCRQLLSEFTLDMEVLCVRSDGRYVSYPLASLIPMAFSKEHMEKI